MQVDGSFFVHGVDYVNISGDEGVCSYQAFELCSEGGRLELRTTMCPWCIKEKGCMAWNM